MYSLQYFWENGLLDFWVLKYVKPMERCRIDKAAKEKDGQAIAYTLIHLSSVFLLFAVGVILAALGLAFSWNYRFIGSLEESTFRFFYWLTHILVVRLRNKIPVHV